MQHTTEAPKQYQCRHIFTDGRRCASPCLRQEEFCYYHHTTRKPIANPRRRRSRSSTFHLPLPDPNDRAGIQLAIGKVLQRIAANEIDPRCAGLLLYGLQIASLNLPKTQPAAKTATEPQTANQTVEEITIDPTLGVLAPRAEVSAITQRKSPVTLLIESMLRDEEETTAQEPTTIPTLQATASDPAILRSCRHPERSEGSRRTLRRHEHPSLSASKQVIQLDGWPISKSGCPIFATVLSSLRWAILTNTAFTGQHHLLHRDLLGQPDPDTVSPCAPLLRKTSSEGF